MWQKKQNNKYIQTFELHEEKFYKILYNYISPCDTDKWLLRKRHTRFYAKDKEGLMVAPYELCQKIKMYFPFSFDKYLCRTGRQIYLTQKGLELISGSTNFPRTVPQINDLKTFAHDTGLTELGLKVLLDYYTLPHTVYGCKALLKLSTPCYYRFQSYAEKTASRQWSKKKVKDKAERVINYYIQDREWHKGVVMAEPRVVKGNIFVKVQLDEPTDIHEIVIDLNEAKETGCIELLHTGTQVAETRGRVIIAGILEISLKKW